MINRGGVCYRLGGGELSAFFAARPTGSVVDAGADSFPPFGGGKDAEHDQCC